MITKNTIKNKQKTLFCRKNKKKTKNLKKVVDMVIWMWYIYNALDKKECKKPL